MVYFAQGLHTNACQHDLATGMLNSLFRVDEGLLDIVSAGCGQLGKMLIHVTLIWIKFCILGQADIYGLFCEFVAPPRK